MLGEKFQESTGRITGQRVINDGNGGVKVETSFAGNGKIYGIDAQEMGTYTAVMQPTGYLYGEGQGIAMTKDGDTISWKGHGIGKPTGKGLGVTYRASIAYQSHSPKYAKLNGVLGVIEWEVDENGTTKGQAWEWR